MSEIIRCVHCGEKTKEKLCSHCSTAEKRGEMHQENLKVLGESWKCPYCVKIGKWKL